MNIGPENVGLNTVRVRLCAMLAEICNDKFVFDNVGPSLHADTDSL